MKIHEFGHNGFTSENYMQSVRDESANTIET